jgi:hypothetical protein
MSEWNASGTVIIACNCDWGCPCNFNAPPTRGYCQGGWCWFIEKGSVDGISVDGLALSLYAKWPGAIHDGNGEAVGFIDDRGNDKQTAALARLVRGELGGPWGIFINTYKLTGPHIVAHTMEPAEHYTRIKIGDVVQLDLEPIRNPVSGAEAHPEVVLPEGLVLKRAVLAKSARFKLTHEISYDHSGQYTAYGRFDYKGAA